MLSNSIKTVVYKLIQSHPSICSTHFWQNWWLHCQIGEIGGRSFHWNGWCWLLIWYAAHLKCRKIANDHYRRGKMRCMDGDGLFRLVWSACWCVCTFELIYDMLSNSHLKWVGVNYTHNQTQTDSNEKTITKDKSTQLTQLILYLRLHSYSLSHSFWTRFCQYIVIYHLRELYNTFWVYSTIVKWRNSSTDG